MNTMIVESLFSKGNLFGSMYCTKMKQHIIKFIVQRKFEFVFLQ